MTHDAHRKAALGFLAVAMSGAVFVHLFAVVSPLDDAFIIFRYVENFLAGKGAVYNGSERVFGISCPLYAVWLAALHAALPGIDLPTLAVRGNAVFLAAAGTLAGLLLRRLGFSTAIAAVASASMLVSEGILRASIGGMESSLFLALLFGSLLAMARGRHTASVLLSSLATLTRPEGVLLLVVTLVAAIGVTRTLRPLIGLLPLVVWAIAATAYYGSPIPHSVIAKAQPLYPLPAGAALGFLTRQAGLWALGGVLALGMTIANGLGTGAFADQPMLGLLSPAIGVAITLWAMWRWWLVETPGARALPAFVFLLVVFYAISNPLLLLWYLPLVQAPWIVMGIAATSDPRGRKLSGRLVRGAVFGLIFSTAIASFIYRVVPSGRSLMAHGGTDARQAAQLAAYARAADWISEHSFPTESIAAPEIGRLGYRLDRRILDACGLVTPEALPFIPVPPEQRGGQLGPISVDFVRATMPDLVATMPAFAERSLLRSNWFGSAYALIHVEPFLPNEPGYRAVLVFRKKPEGLR